MPRHLPPLKVLLAVMLAMAPGLSILGLGVPGLSVPGMNMMTAAQAQTAQSLENRPYDEKLLRLAEIIGAVHFLRELCSGSDGTLWRDRMRELLDAEGTSALRKARLTRSFNNGYRSYSRTYQTCTPSAQTAVTKFMGEAAEIADTLVKTVP